MASRNSSRAMTRRAQVVAPRNALAAMSTPNTPAAPKVKTATPAPKPKGLFYKSHRPGFDRT